MSLFSSRPSRTLALSEIGRSDDSHTTALGAMLTALLSVLVLILSFTLPQALGFEIAASQSVVASLTTLAEVTLSVSSPVVGALLLSAIAGSLAAAFAGFARAPHEWLHTLLLAVLWGMIVWCVTFFVIFPLLMQTPLTDLLLMIADEWFLPFLMYGVSLVSVTCTHGIRLMPRGPSRWHRNAGKRPWWLEDSFDSSTALHSNGAHRS